MEFSGSPVGNTLARTNWETQKQKKTLWKENQGYGFRIDDVWYLSDPFWGLVFLLNSFKKASQNQTKHSLLKETWQHGQFSFLGPLLKAASFVENPY